MAWNFRKRVKVFPGVHLNFSKRGVSTSIGPKGAKITLGKRGTYLNTSIPGTGLYSRQKISDSHNVFDEKKHENEPPKKRESFLSLKRILKYLFILWGLIAILFLIVNFFQWITGHFDSSSKNRDALLGYGIVAGLFIVVYFNRIKSFFKSKHTKETNHLNCNDENQAKNI